jgi:transcriptional regulator with XRE-family HTH domain
MKDQLIQIMEDSGLTATRLADLVGVQRSSISHILSGRNKPSYDFILKIIEKFPDVDIEWLITGKGEKNKQKNTPEKESIKEKNKVPAELFNEVNQNKPAIDVSLKKETESQRNNEFTNVNKTEKVIILYTDGSFKEYHAR